MDRKAQLRLFGREQYNKTITVSQTPGWDYKMQAVLAAANEFGLISKSEIQEVLKGWSEAEEEFEAPTVRNCKVG